MRLPRGGGGANFLCYVHVFAVSFSACIYGFQAEAGCLLRRLSQSVFRSDAVLALVVIGTTARLAFQKPPPRPLSTAMLAGAHQVGDAWHMLVPYARPPPGLEHLQFSECFGHQAAEMAAELDNDAPVAVHQLKHGIPCFKQKRRRPGAHQVDDAWHMLAPYAGPSAGLIKIKMPAKATNRNSIFCGASAESTKLKRDLSLEISCL